MLHSLCQQIWKTQQWPQDWKMSIFIPIPKNVQTTAQLHSSHTLAKIKILKVKLQQYVNWELPDVQDGFRKGQGTRDQVANICWIIEKSREFQKNIYFCFTDYTKSLVCMDHNKLRKILQEIGNQSVLPTSWETCLQVKKQQLEPDMEKWTGSKLGKEYVKAVYCHSAHLTSM